MCHQALSVFFPLPRVTDCMRIRGWFYVFVFLSHWCTLEFMALCVVPLLFLCSYQIIGSWCSPVLSTISGVDWSAHIRLPGWPHGGEVFVRCKCEYEDEDAQIGEKTKVTLLGKEQVVDGSQKDMCEMLLDKAEDDMQTVDVTISDLEKE